VTGRKTRASATETKPPIVLCTELRITNFEFRQKSEFNRNSELKIQNSAQSAVGKGEKSGVRAHNTHWQQCAEGKPYSVQDGWTKQIKISQSFGKPKEGPI